MSELATAALVIGLIIMLGLVVPSWLKPHDYVAECRQTQVASCSALPDPRVCVEAALKFCEARYPTDAGR